MTIVYVFKQHILRRLKLWAANTDTTVDDLLIKVIQKSLLPIFYFGVFYMALQSLSLSPRFVRGLGIVAMVVISVLFVRTVMIAVIYGLQSSLKESQDKARREKQLKGIRALINIFIWAIALIFCWIIWASKYLLPWLDWELAALPWHWQRRPYSAICSVTSLFSSISLSK